MKTLLFFILISLPVITQGQNAIEINSKTYTPKQLHADIDFALKKYGQIHPDFFKETPKDTVIMRFDELKASIKTPITRYEFMKIFCPVAFTVIRDGHNFTFGLEEELQDYIASGGRFFPIPVIIRNRRLYCNSSLTDIPYYSEILKINDKPAKDLIELILAGYSAESDEFEETITSGWFSNAYWSNIGGFDAYLIHYISSDNNQEEEILLKGLITDQIDSLRYNSTKADFEFEEIHELSTAVFKFNNALIDVKVFRSFCDSIFQIIKVKDYENLVIDIRQNLGGTTRASDILFEYITDKPVSQLDSIETKISKEKKQGFINAHRKHLGWFKWHHYIYYPIYIRSNPYRKKILTAQNGTFVTTYFPPKTPKENPLRFSGNLYLLTSKYTYSAANGLAAAFKCHGLGPVIGQETGQPTVSTADWEAFVLPNTKIKCAASVSRIYWACGKNDGHGVIPDYVISEADTTDIDNEMEFLKKLGINILN